MKVEFYQRGKRHPMVTIDGVPPPVDSLISIHSEAWRVVGVTWAVDQPTGERPTMRANVDLCREKGADPK